MNKSTIMNWDELNLICETVPDLVADYRNRKDRKAVERWCDYLEFVLCLIYDYGWKDAEQMIGIVPIKDGLDIKTVNLEIKGETYRDRVLRQLDEDSVDGVLRIIETEAHRDYNTAIYDAGKTSGIQGLKKQWWTMADGRVRDTHVYIHGMKVGLDDAFYTDDGDSALAPGGFELPENNVNCRCWITLSI